MQFKFTQLTAAILTGLAVAKAAPSVTARDAPAAMPALDNANTLSSAASEVSASGDVSTQDYLVGIAYMGPGPVNGVYINVNDIPSVCMEVAPAYDNQASYLYLVGGIACVFYADHGCTGLSVRVGGAGPVYHDLSFGIGTLDNAISSYGCNVY